MAEICHHRFEIDSEPMTNGLFFRLYNNIDYHPVSDVTYINVTLKYWAIVLTIARSRVKVTSDVNGELPSINLLLHWLGN